MRLQWLPLPPPFLGALLRRAGVLWLLGRMIIVFFGGVGTLAETVCLGFPTSVVLTLFVAGLTLLDAHRRHEIVLYANLGGSRRGIFLLACLPSLTLETLTCLIPL